MTKYGKGLIILLMPIFTLFFFPLPSFSSTWSTLYGGTAHDEVSSITGAGDTGYIVVGNAQSFGVESQAWVLKIDPTGGIGWQKIYKNAEKESYRVSSVDIISNGGYILAGDALTCYETDGNLCQGYGWLTKLSSDGQILWQKGVKDTEGYGSSFSAVQATADHGFVTAGRCGTSGTGTAQSKLWVVKFNSDGGIQWQKRFHHDNISDSYANSIFQTTDGGYIVAGTLFSGVTGWSHWNDIWVLKLSGSGDVEWHKMYRSPASYDIGWSVRQTSDGGYVVGGQTEDSVGYGTDGLVLKLDETGNIQWQKNYETYGGDSIKIIDQTSDGGYIIGGLYQGGGIAAKLNQNGAIDWQETYQSNAIVSMQQTSDGFIIASGGSGTHEGTTSGDLLVTKTDEAGKIDKCHSVANSAVQVYDASLTVDTFTVTITSPDLRIVNTLAIPVDTGISPTEVCPFKTLRFVSSTTQSYITSSPEGIQCVGKTCSGLYPGGSDVGLTLYPGADSSLVAWGGDCSACGAEASCSVNMDADKTCTAIFTAQKGDIDGDGGVEMGDAILALQVIAGMNPSLGIGYPLSGADVNGSGKMDMAEVIYILQKAAGLRP